jgi:hypothetical protein
VFAVVAKPVVHCLVHCHPTSSHPTSSLPPPTSTCSMHCRSSAGEIGAWSGLDAAVPALPARAQFVHTTGLSQSPGRGASWDHPSIACHGVVGGPHISRSCLRGRPRTRQIPDPQPGNPEAASTPAAGVRLANGVLADEPRRFRPILACEILTRPSMSLISCRRRAAFLMGTTSIRGT